MNGGDMTSDEEDKPAKNDPIIREIIALERNYFFEKRNVKTGKTEKIAQLN